MNDYFDPKSKLVKKIGAMNTQIWLKSAMKCFVPRRERAHKYTMLGDRKK